MQRMRLLRTRDRLAVVAEILDAIKQAREHVGRQFCRDIERVLLGAELLDLERATRDADIPERQAGWRGKASFFPWR